MNLRYVLHRKFAQKFIPDFIRSVNQYFESAPDPEIRQIQKEQFDQILSDLEKIAERTYTTLGRHTIIEQFELIVYARLMKSDYLKLRIDGLKGVNNVIRQVIHKQKKTLTEDYILHWIHNNQLLEEVVGVKRHQQVLGRASPLLQFMYKKSSLDTKTLESLWELTNDELLRNDLFKILCAIEFDLDSKELEFFATKIANMEYSKITEDTLRLIYKSCKSKPNTKYAQILLDIAFNNKCNLSESALKNYLELIKSLPYDPYKKDILVNCMHRKMSVMSLRLIKGILEQCDNCSEVINELNLFEVFFNEIHMDLQSTKEKITFLGYLLENSKVDYRLPIKYYYELWEILIVDKENPEVLFEFLSNIASSASSVLCYVID